MSISTKEARDLLKSTGDVLKGATSDLLASSDFISRTIGMNNSYEDIMLLVQALGRQPVSLLGKDYLFIFDHVRRNYQQGTTVRSMMYGGGGEYWCPKFTFYKEKPTVRFADPYNDTLNLLDRWMPNFTPASTLTKNTNFFYAESNDGHTENKKITDAESNMGTATGQRSTSFQNLATCDLIKKTNENFNTGKYNTLVARFHTSLDLVTKDDSTQTAISEKYGLSHGRNLLKLNPDTPNGYDNPYCRVWTYHHQYNRMLDAIRPFADEYSAEKLEKDEFEGDYGNGGFRTIGSKKYGFDGGSKRLDDHGVLNYDNGFVNIAPTAKIKDYFEHKIDGKNKKSVSTKRCMFSIENLAWRDDKMKYDQFEAYGLSAEQRGPLGGRIMWFPPYDISFSENVNVKWNQNEFIGRGENIYTYTNTERRGTLSFTMLIDHPSILDYWTGQERNGMKHRGKDLLPGNEYGVDGIEPLKGKNNQEQTLLRFFAGCDILTGKPQKYWAREKTPAIVPPPAKENVPKANPPKPDEAKPVKKKIYCFAFYPNNYSGKDDRTNPKVNPIHYLLNGMGTQQRVNSTTKMAEDVYVDMYSGVLVNGQSTGYGGYEMKTGGKGVSVATQILDEDFTDISKTFTDTTTQKKAQYLSDKDGKAIKAKYASEDGYVEDADTCLAKIVDSSALSLAAAKGNLAGGVSSDVKNKPYEWYRKRWYYRVDDDTTPQKLMSRESYLDTSSNQFNSKGIYECKYIKDEFNIDIDKDKDTIVSLTDMYMALEGDDSSIVASYSTDDKVKTINSVVKGENGCKITDITFYGHASIQGNNASQRVNNTRNTSLAKNRALTLKDWMGKNQFPEIDKAKYKDVDLVQKNGDKYNVNNPITKFWRSAYVVIEYEVSQTETANKIDTAAQSNTLNRVDSVTSSPSKTVSPGNLTGATDWLHNTPEGKKVLEEGVPTTFKYRDSNGVWQEITYKVPVNEKTFTMADVYRITGKNYNDPLSVDYDDSLNNYGITVSSSTVKRYDNEGEFFELLDKKSPFLHHLITDKIKYFDPAYHAISPEGFNARLTFLHQCTRQGATIGNSDPDVVTAYNLAFGKPPVCVLRIGDFYYTKIIINSLVINYDEPQWDLNPEGIGVMPMFAKITIDFNFIGGSDLAGPIARLQNAVSFNYYANTSVYDNRAERIEYDPTGTGKEIKYKPYNYPNAPGRSTAGIVDETTGKFLKTDSEGEWEDV